MVGGVLLSITEAPPDKLVMSDFVAMLGCHNAVHAPSLYGCSNSSPASCLSSRILSILSWILTKSSGYLVAAMLCDEIMEIAMRLLPPKPDKAKAS